MLHKRFESKLNAMANFATQALMESEDGYRSSSGKFRRNPC